MGYFCGGLATTGIMVQFLRGTTFAYTSPWMLLFGSLGLLIGTQMVNYQRSPVLKHLLYGGFISTMALSMVPLINMAALPVIYDALFATGITMGALGIVAYNAPGEQFLRWGGALGMGLGAMIGMGLINMFYPSRALWNIYLYGGLALFSMLVLFDV